MTWQGTASFGSCRALANLRWPNGPARAGASQTGVHSPSNLKISLAQRDPKISTAPDVARRPDLRVFTVSDKQSAQARVVAESRRARASLPARSGRSTSVGLVAKHPTLLLVETQVLLHPLAGEFAYHSDQDILCEGAALLFSLAAECATLPGRIPRRDTLRWN